MSQYQFKFFNRNYLTKEQCVTAWQGWINQNKDKYELFAITATANAGYSKWYDTKASPRKYKDWFQTDVLKKIRKRLSKNNDYIKHIDFYYEFGEKGSYFKSLHSSKKPHHIHGFLIIPKPLSRKIWIEEIESASDRLMKDFKSVGTIASVLIEPIYNFKGWFYYITKGKDINEHAY
jgi:hypothetical protein